MIWWDAGRVLRDNKRLEARVERLKAANQDLRDECRWRKERIRQLERGHERQWNINLHLKEQIRQERRKRAEVYKELGLYGVNVRLSRKK